MKANAVIGVLVGGISTLSGLTMGILFLLLWVYEAKFQLWSEVPCVLESCEIVDHGPDEKRPFEIVARYRYAVDGQEFESTNVFSTMPERDRHYEDLSMERRAFLTTPKDSLFCYVNPSDPSAAILKKGSLLQATLFLIFPLLTTGFGVAILLISWRFLRGTLHLSNLRLGASTWIGSPTVTIFFAVFALAGMCFCWVLLVKPWLKSREAASWVEVPCDIVWSTLRSSDSGSGSDDQTYRPDIFYRYEFQAEVYHSNSSEFLFPNSNHQEKLAILQQYTTGSQQRCYIDPKVPERAVLQREWQWPRAGLVPIAFVVMGLGGVYANLRSKQRNSLTRE